MIDVAYWNGLQIWQYGAPSAWAGSANAAAVSGPTEVLLSTAGFAAAKFDSATALLYEPP